MAKTETLAENEVAIKNIGPIESLRLPVTPGKITVLTGANGAGKSQALDAVDALATGRKKLANRDGTTGGVAAGYGVRIKVAPRRQQP